MPVLPEKIQRSIEVSLRDEAVRNWEFSARQRARMNKRINKIARPARSRNGRYYASADARLIVAHTLFASIK